MVEILGAVCVLLGTAVLVQASLLRAGARERAQLQRMAFAESKSERIAALLPEPVRVAGEARPPRARPGKPEGV